MSNYGKNVILARQCVIVQRISLNGKIIHKEWDEYEVVCQLELHRKSRLKVHALPWIASTHVLDENYEGK